MEKVDDGVYMALGIVSPYNAGVVLSEDQSYLKYLTMEINGFYALEFAK